MPEPETSIPSECQACHRWVYPDRFHLCDPITPRERAALDDDRRRMMAAIDDLQRYDTPLEAWVERQHE